MGELVAAVAGHEPLGVEEEALIGKLLLRDAKSGVDARDGHGSRALDVVIEAEDLVLVAFEKVEGVVVAEVLELDEDVGPAAAGFGDEFLDEFVVGFARHAFLTQGMLMPLISRSPRPRMRWPSVTTRTSTSSFGQFSMISRTRPLSLIEMKAPRG